MHVFSLNMSLKRAAGSFCERIMQPKHTQTLHENKWIITRN